MKKPSLLILAAGMGSRYGGLKQFDAVGPNGETIMDYSVYDAVEAGFGKIIFVIRESFKDDFLKKIVKKYSQIIDIDYVCQELTSLTQGYTINPNREKPWGTGHAVMVAHNKINTPFAVINADDFYGKNSFKIICNQLIDSFSKKGEFCMVGFSPSKTLSESGSVSRGVCSFNNDSLLTKIEEHHNVSLENNLIKGDNGKGERVIIDNSALVSMNMWGFTPDVFTTGIELFQEFLEEKGEELKSEFYIPFVVNSLIDSKLATCKVLSTPDNWFGVTYKEDKESVVLKLKEMIDSGLYPSPLINY